MQNVARPTLVAIAMKFGLGAEIQSPAGFLAYFPTGNSLIKHEIYLECQWLTGLSAGDGL